MQKVGPNKMSKNFWYHRVYNRIPSTQLHSYQSIDDAIIYQFVKNSINLGANYFYFHMNENLEILQKEKGNKRTIRFLSYLGILVFSKIICFKNVMKIPGKYQKKIEKSSRLHEKTSLSGP